MFGTNPGTGGSRSWCQFLDLGIVVTSCSRVVDRNTDLAMELESDTEHNHNMMIDHKVPTHNMQIDPSRSRFPCCIVWTPLPVVSWLLPFVGHIGIGREDGVILDFAGPNFVCVDNFTFGAVTRYIQISKDKCSITSHPATMYRSEEEYKLIGVSRWRVECGECGNNDFDERKMGLNDSTVKQPTIIIDETVDELAENIGDWRFSESD
ncbi:unnamed protein product [Lactuca saligna]|uniref:Uncharacterized protein n=1 Tax=Lactuca saligna TaxID=75948 RepID=A0AA36DZ77_LACSI|nr:unnamed protein product [Lactuca saligna]